MPKAADGRVEMLRTLRLARLSAVKARTQAANQLHALVVTAPDPLRAQLRGLSLARLVAAAADLEAPAAPATAQAAAEFTLRLLARRHRHLSEEIAAVEAQLARLVAEVAGALAAVKGVGPDTATALLVAAGDNPERLRSEGAFAHLCGVAPIPASSGRTQRHRLNRGGNRDANRALHQLVIGRLGRDARTRAYVERRTREGKSKKEIIRCLKRYAARELYRLLPPPTDSRSASRGPVPAGNVEDRSSVDQASPTTAAPGEPAARCPRSGVPTFPTPAWPTTGEAPRHLTRHRGVGTFSSEHPRPDRSPARAAAGQRRGRSGASCAPSPGPPGGACCCSARSRMTWASQALRESPAAWAARRAAS